MKRGYFFQFFSLLKNSPNSILPLLGPNNIREINCVNLMTKELFYLKIHKQELSQVIAACDEDVLGKRFQGKKIKVHISDGFYKGELKKIEDVLSILQRCDNFNIAGSNIIRACIQQGLISEESVLHFGDIPIAMKLVI